MGFPVSFPVEFKDPSLCLYGIHYRAVYSPGGTAQLVNNLPANAGYTRDAGLIPGGEDLLEKEMANRSGILAYRVPWTEQSGGLQSMGL